MFTLTYDDCIRTKERFEGKIDRSGGPDACHPHRSCTQYADGYGKMQMVIDGTSRTVTLHRIAHVLATGGSIDSRDQIDHQICSNPRCANPAHLRKTDAKGNAQTRRANTSQRHRPGRRAFTDLQAMDYRHRWAAGEPLASLVAGADVRTSTMWYLVTGATYKHLPVLERAAGFASWGGTCRVTEVQVAETKRRLLNGDSQASIAREYGISSAQMSRIARGQQWKHIEPAIPELTLAMAAD